MVADLILHSKRHICPSEKQKERIRPIVTKVQGDVLQKKSLVSTRMLVTQFIP